MKVWLESNIGEAIRECTSKAKAEAGPELSCEASGLAPKRATELLLEGLRAWRKESVICFLRVGAGRHERARACLLDDGELEHIISQALHSEEVVSIVDITALGGCSFDFSPDEAPKGLGTVVLLLTVWGVHEAMVTSMARELGESTFRQAKPPRLDR